MKKGIACTLLLGVLSLSVGARPTMALDTQNPAKPVNPGTLRKAQPEKLSRDECTGAGGTISENKNCASGSACYRADQAHVVHVLCVSKQ
jgi:hypothetical protein